MAQTIVSERFILTQAPDRLRRYFFLASARLLG
jgi:hypothetical protein